MYIFSNISILYKLSIYNNIFVKKLYKILICHILMNKQIVIMEIAHSCSLNRGLYTIAGINRFLLQIKVFNRFLRFHLCLLAEWPNFDIFLDVFMRELSWLEFPVVCNYYYWAFFLRSICALLFWFWRTESSSSSSSSSSGMVPLCSNALWLLSVTRPRVWPRSLIFCLYAWCCEDGT